MIYSTFENVSVYCAIQKRDTVCPESIQKCFVDYLTISENEQKLLLRIAEV